MSTATPGRKPVSTGADLPLDSAAADAWRDSYLAELPEPAQAQLARLSVSVRVPAGEMIYRASDRARLALVVRGLSRVFASSPDGRHVTIRYAHPGDCIGVIAVVTPRQAVDVQAVTECEVLFVDVPAVRRLASSQPAVGWVLAQAAGLACTDVIDMMTGNLFGSVRERVARHLLDLAEDVTDGLAVRVEQQDIADAIGSVREVVARALRDLQHEGLVVREKQRVLLTDPEGLHSVASGQRATAPRLDSNRS